MFQAALLATMNTALAPWRTAVSSSIALMPNAPSPLTDHLAAGKGERRRDRERHADAQAAERAGVHVGARAQADPGEAQDVAAVGDADVVGRGHLGDRREDPARMDLAVGGGAADAAARAGVALAMAPAQALGPAPIDTGRPVAGGLDDRGERQARGRCEPGWPRRLSISSPAVSAMRTKRALGNTAGEP